MAKIMIEGLSGEEGEIISKGFGCSNYGSSNLLAMIFSQCNMNIDYKDTDLKKTNDRKNWKLKSYQKIKTIKK